MFMLFKHKHDKPHRPLFLLPFSFLGNFKSLRLRLGHYAFILPTRDIIKCTLEVLLGIFKRRRRRVIRVEIRMDKFNKTIDVFRRDLCQKVAG